MDTLARTCPRLLRAGMVSVLIGSILFALSIPMPVDAGTTPTQCDGVPKYWCHYVSYTQGTYRYVNGRWYKGAIDGGAYKWRLDYAKDWYWTGSSWGLGYTGDAPTVYRTNVPMYTWWCGCTQYSYSTSSVRVTMVNKYWEDNPYDHPWWGDVTYHYL